MYAHVHSARGYFDKESSGRKYLVDFDLASCELKIINNAIVLLGRKNGKFFEITIDSSDISDIIEFSLQSNIISLEDFQNVFQRKKHLDYLQKKIEAMSVKNQKLLEIVSSAIKAMDSAYEN